MPAIATLIPAASIASTTAGAMLVPARWLFCC